jgi:hypothetical protein
MRDFSSKMRGITTPPSTLTIVFAVFELRAVNMATLVEFITAPVSNTITAHPILSVLLTLLTYLLVQSLKSSTHLSHIPGPWFAPFTDLYLIYKTWRGETFRELNVLCEKYGPIFRIAPNFVVVGDPAEVKKVWGVRSTFDRASGTRGFVWIRRMIR